MSYLFTENTRLYTAWSRITDKPSRAVTEKNKSTITKIIFNFGSTS